MWVRASSHARAAADRTLTARRTARKRQPRSANKQTPSELVSCVRVHPLVPAILSTFCADLLLVGVFAYLHRQYRERYLRLWAIGWSGSAARHLMATLLLLLGPNLALAIVLQTLEPLALLFILEGTYAFAGRRMPRLWIVGALATAAWAVHGEVLHLPLLLTRLPAFGFLGAVTAWTGAVFLRQPGQSPGTRLTGWCLILWGLHLIDHPFLRDMVWFPPWGFSIATVLELAVAVGIVVVYFERTRTSLEQSEHRYRTLFEGALEGVYRAQSGGRFLEANPALIRLLGYDTGEQLCAIDPARDLFEDEADRHRIEQELQSNGEVLNEEATWRRKGGDAVIVNLHVPDACDGLTAAATTRASSATSPARAGSRIDYARPRRWRPSDGSRAA